MSMSFDPMCYPILFPRGDQGWHDSMQHVAEYRTTTYEEQADDDRCSNFIDITWLCEVDSVQFTALASSSSNAAELSR